MAKRITYGSVPTVDLLPDRQRAERRHEETLPKLLIALIASAVVAGIIWAVGMVPVYFAQQESDRLAAESQALTAEIASYEEAQALLQAVGSRESDRRALTADEVFFAELRDEALDKLPGGTSFVRFITQLPGSAGDAAYMAEPECLATGAVATITIATADTAPLDRAAEFIESVREIDGFLCGSVIDSTLRHEGETRITEVQVRVTFDDTVRSQRYADNAAGTADAEDDAS